MRRIVFLGSFLSLIAAVCLVGLSLRAHAQDAAPSTAESGFVGSWRVTVTTPDGATFPVLSSYLSDGTTFHDAPPIQPAAPGSPNALLFLSSGHGIWGETGADASAVTFEVLLTDEYGTYLGRQTVSGTQRLDPTGDRFTGEYVIVVTDPAGTVVAMIPTTAEGVRIVIEPPAAGTPGTTPDA